MNNKLSVLLIDDDPTANFINKKMIEQVDKEVEITCALNGLEALSFIYSSTLKEIPEGGIPLIIFLDLNMPVMDGFTFLESLDYIKHPFFIAVPIVVLTNSIYNNDMERAKDFVIYDFITKPLTIEKVTEIIQRVKNRNGLL